MAALFLGTIVSATELLLSDVYRYPKASVLTINTNARVNVIFANDRVFMERHQNPEKKFYSIGDAYVHADIVLYPNSSDAFGNPVIEACAYRKPVVVSEYPNLKEITDKGFDFIKIKLNSSFRIKSVSTII